MDAARLARRILEAVPGDGGAQGLLERVFGRSGDAAAAAAVAYWGITVECGTRPRTEDVRAVEEELLALLESGDSGLEGGNPGG